MRLRFLFALCALLPAVGVRAAAQASANSAAYDALVLTPAGALPPLPYARGVPASRHAMTVRYGYFPDYGGQAFHHLAATAAFPAGRVTWAVTAGTSLCNDCDTRFMTGVELFQPLTSTGVNVALHPGVGLAHVTGPTEATLVSATLSLPIALAVGSDGGAAFVPFLDPGIGLGHLSSGSFSESGVRPMLGGGLRVLLLGRRVALDGGFQKVFIKGGDATLGVGLTVAR